MEGAKVTIGSDSGSRGSPQAHQLNLRAHEVSNEDSDGGPPTQSFRETVALSKGTDLGPPEESASGKTTIRSQIGPTLDRSVETMILSQDIRKGFAISEKDQGERREACEALEKKLNLLTVRTQALEETVGAMKDELRMHKEEIEVLQGTKQDLQNKVEQLENSLRRNNLRVLNVPEGENLKGFVILLIKTALWDIQRIHKDPLKRNPNNSKSQKILINFQTYGLKEKIFSRQ
ncbi:hypothetical protein NDU88_005658 [Pleurodeles waltl]|uniref:Uncharacterized protein n=1 Tax=Pleurodeles waltl TaxID=8319 RepID=A0AAV7MA01_PLEWA|nr:hypothetical protein NDU88_005658 [Pleurodeles waltl]